MKDHTAYCCDNKVIATHLRADARDVRDIDWSVPTAVVLGNEREGATRLPPCLSCTLEVTGIASCNRVMCSVQILLGRSAGPISERNRDAGQSSKTQLVAAGMTSALWLTAGVSEEVLALADGCALVPMLGFVDSYNVSVAAALTLYEV